MQSVDAQCLAQWCAQGQSQECLLYLCNGAMPLRLSHRGGSGGDAEHCRLAPHWQGLLSVHRGLCLVSGAAQVWPLAGAELVKLQCFIDQACPPHAGQAPGAPLGWLEAPRERVNGSLASWYVSRAVQGRPQALAFAQALRRWESYHLVCFLHEHSAQGSKLHELAQRYGVSVSHFRRLCRQALGACGKTQLRDWRAAHALLAVADGPVSLTDVALACGYASSSHFSRDIRQMLGVIPSSLVDITRIPCQ